MTVVGEVVICEVETRGKGKKKVNVGACDLHIGKNAYLHFKCIFGKDINIDDVEPGETYTIEGFTKISTYKKDGYTNYSEELYITKLK